MDLDIKCITSGDFKKISKGGNKLMCKQFIVYLMNGSEVIEHRVNCNNSISAQNIAEGIFPKHRVIDIKET